VCYSPINVHRIADKLNNTRCLINSIYNTDISNQRYNICYLLNSIINCNVTAVYHRWCTVKGYWCYSSDKLSKHSTCQALNLLIFSHPKFDDVDFWNDRRSLNDQNETLENICQCRLRYLEGKIQFSSPFLPS